VTIHMLSNKEVRAAARCCRCDVSALDCPDWVHWHYQVRDGAVHGDSLICTGCQTAEDKAAVAVSDAISDFVWDEDGLIWSVPKWHSAVE
jgi:hypothetical protein